MIGWLRIENNVGHSDDWMIGYSEKSSEGVVDAEVDDGFVPAEVLGEPAVAWVVAWVVEGEGEVEAEGDERDVGSEAEAGADGEG